MLDANFGPINSSQSEAVAAVQDLIVKLNNAVDRAVESGLVVELTRACRHHSEQCGWGDQLAPRFSKAPYDAPANP